jgi:ubiquinone/menaquinone biosynthesis C-methylase UbiE
MPDKSDFFHNFLNYPAVFLTVRSILDGGQLRYLKELLKEYRVTSIIDVGCGCGVFSKITDSPYLGIDYNEAFIDFCKKRFGSERTRFMVMDARELTTEKEFDTAIIINSIHHFSDEDVVKIFLKMKRAASRLVIIHDAVPRKNPISKLFYRLDRGRYFRSSDQQRRLMEEAGLKATDSTYFKRFPGIYLHSTFICSVNE